MKPEDQMAKGLNAALDEAINYSECVLTLASFQRQDGGYSIFYGYRGNMHTAIGLMERFKTIVLRDTCQPEVSEQTPEDDGSDLL
jgi:hypothetical protein